MKTSNVQHPTLNVERLTPTSGAGSIYAGAAVRHLFLLIVVLVLVTGSVQACRYNVRDAGFVEFEGDTYTLHGFFRPNAPANLIAQYSELASNGLWQTNIRLEWLSAEAGVSHPARTHLQAGETNALLSGVLVSPDGQALSLVLCPPDGASPRGLSEAVEALATSPTREEILRNVIGAFGVVLLIEGPTTEANARARQTVAAAIDEIKVQMQTMPKPIREPPVLVVLARAALERERVLLWSLGLDVGQITEPRAVVIYGKARWMGPLMQAAEITVDNLAGLFAIVGADCECGLDLNWTRGTMLPRRWDERRHAAVAKALGFDPENPLVKVEVSRIFGRFETAAATPSTRTAPRPTASTIPLQPRDVPVPAEHPVAFRQLVMALAGLAAVVAIGSVFLLFRRASKR